MREELSRKQPAFYHDAITRKRNRSTPIRANRKGLREECCIARVRKYVPCYHRCLYVQGYEQTRAAVYSKLPFMKLNFMVCGIRLYPIVESCRSMNLLSSRSRCSFFIAFDRLTLPRSLIIALFKCRIGFALYRIVYFVYFMWSNFIFFYIISSSL